jgi:ketosteroid isomerase-like protein
MNETSNAGELLAQCQEFLDWRTASTYNPAGLPRYYAEDALVEDKPAKGSRQGHDEIGEQIEKHSRSGFDATARARRCYVGSDHAVVEWTWSGVKDQVDFSVDGVGIFDLADGRIAREVHYWAHPTWSIRSTG